LYHTINFDVLQLDKFTMHFIHEFALRCMQSFPVR